jgi:diguanylate cyclase (GGDEF)-like protein
MSDMDSDHVSIPIRYHRTKAGIVFPVEISASQLTLGGRAVILISIRDITERVRNEQHILRLSFHDALTGLYNRRFYEEELRRLDTARNLPLSFIIGDVNGLKLINDSFGHAKGDELLQTVAAAMKRECRADDILVRLSGDEFAVLLPKTTTSEAEQLMNRFRSRLAQEFIGLLQVSVAFGSATKMESEVPFTTVFKSAEDAMYRSKLYESQSV